jgi:hypothetical protein
MSHQIYYIIYHKKEYEGGHRSLLQLLQDEDFAPKTPMIEKTLKVISNL